MAERPEVGEELLLGGPGDVAVHGVGAEAPRSLLHQRSMPKPYQACAARREEEELDEELEDEAQQVEVTERRASCPCAFVSLVHWSPCFLAVPPLALCDEPVRMTSSRGHVTKMNCRAQRRMLEMGKN